jgi:hypothetical protein
MAEAKTVVKNKFWIVEEDGHQVGTIQAVPDGVVLVRDQKREKFSSLKGLVSKHNIQVTASRSKKLKLENSVYGYPCDTKPNSPVYDVRLKLPLYTKDQKSKSYYCAGYYLIDLEGTWMSVFCPKKIVLTRHKFLGPFGDKDSLNQCLKQITS